METKHNNIHEMDLGDIQRSDYVVDYIDGDIVIVDDLKSIPQSGPIKFNLIIIVICIEGKLYIDLNGTEYEIGPNDILICTPFLILNNYHIAPDFKGKVFGLSQRIAQQLLHSSRYIWNKAFYLSRNPILHVSPEGMELIHLYYDLVYLKVRKKKRLYHEEVMKMLLRAAFYEFSSDVTDYISDDQDDWMRQGDLIFKKFMELLYQGNLHSRSVSDYADRLHITPKYLSVVAKKISGKTASKWINEHMAEEIRSLLKYSTLSIKEISQELDFPNLSFFGKYVKAHLGVSPKNYRKMFVK